METTSRKRCFVIVLAAGKSERFSGELPKQYCSLGGRSILRRSLDAFASLPFVDGITAVINPEHEALYEAAVRGMGAVLSPPARGGESRQESVYNALGSLKADRDDIVLVHDAARPFVRRSDIEALYDALQTTPAATLAARAVYTMVRGDADDAISERLERGGVWSLHTPQGFAYGPLAEAHEKLRGSSLTDDTAVIETLGIRPALIECSPDNIKITRAEDLVMAEKLAGVQMCTRTGSGFDVHEFTDSGKGFVRLCGVDVPFGKVLKGHSDADAPLHALTDALLGAAGEGDIGMLFPPSEPKWKNADSAVFVRRACDIIRSRGGSVINADITLICQAPAIGPFREKMRASVAAMLGIEESRVNIKATTTEGLGFAGRGEGLAAQAAVSVHMPQG